MVTNRPPWQPSIIRRFIRGFATAASTVLVETDRGNGYLKCMGNRAGDHVLACEWVVELICQRAAFLSANMMRLMASVWPEGEFPFMSEEEGP